MLKVLLLISIQLFFFFTMPDFVSAEVDLSERKIVLDISMKKYSVDLVSDYLEDRSGTLKIEDILNDRFGESKLQWQKSETESLGFGFNSNPYWVRFTIVNPRKVEIEWSLEIDYPHIDSIKLYKSYSSGGYDTREGGDLLPFDEREMKYRNVVFNLTQKGETEFIYYLRFQTSSSLNIPMWIWSPYLLTSMISKEMILFGLYYGILLIIALFSLFSFFSIRDRMYLYYFFWILGYGLYQISINGLAFQYFWPNLPGWQNYTVPFFVFFGSIWCLQFGRVVLNTEDYLPLFDLSAKVMVAVAISGLFLTFILPYSIIIRASAIGVLVVVTFLEITGIVSLYRGILFARYYVIAWSALFIGGFAFAMKSLGLLPDNFITNYSQQIGSALQIILLTLAFAGYVNMINKEKQEAQANTINALQTAAGQKDEFLVQTSKKNMEIEELNYELTKRNFDLYKANEQISISEEKYRILVEGSNDIIFSLNENLDFLSVNKAIIAHLNIKPKEVISRNFTHLIHDGNGDTSVSKQLVQEHLDIFLTEKRPVTFKAEFKSSFSTEPKEVSVKLEYVNIEDRNEIIGKATRLEEDALIKFIEFEKQCLNFGNYFITAEDISHRITRNLARYMDQRQVHIIRIAVREIIINSIEHGNLNISFEEKGRHLDDDSYFEFIAKRQRDPMYSGKRVRIEYTIEPGKAVYQITDDGEGFDHKHILQGGLDVNTDMLAYGRGIQMAKSCFDEINYNSKGNQVLLIKYLS